MSRFFDETDQTDVGACDALVTGLSRNGLVDNALEMFRWFKGQGMELNIVSWTSIIASCSQNGKEMEALELFRQKQIEGVKPNFVTIPSLLPACGNIAALMHGKAAHCFALRRGISNNVMSKEHGLKPRVEHYACLVTLLGRAGKLDEAHSMIKKMPFEPDACVLGALPSSCGVHGNVNLGESVAKKLFNLEPKNPGNYILLSNIYASEGMWAEVDSVRDTMKSHGLRKNPGCSWIELKNRVFDMSMRDKAHLQTNQIIDKLDQLSSEMKKSGCFPNTEFALQDVEEHSEKLAVALGLLNTPPGVCMAELGLEDTSIQRMNLLLRYSCGALVCLLQFIIFTRTNDCIASINSPRRQSSISPVTIML
ncbi:hypothetical protein ACFX2K_042768 [Malus domestica]